MSRQERDLSTGAACEMRLTASLLLRYRGLHVGTVLASAEALRFASTCFVSDDVGWMPPCADKAEATARTCTETTTTTMGNSNCRRPNQTTTMGNSNCRRLWDCQEKPGNSNCRRRGEMLDDRQGCWPYADRDGTCCSKGPKSPILWANLCCSPTVTVPKANRCSWSCSPFFCLRGWLLPSSSRTTVLQRIPADLMV